MLEKEFKEIINNIKDDIRTAQLKAMQEVNRNLIMLYFRLGKILYDNFKYGNKFIEQVSRELKLEFPNNSGFSVRNLKYMKKFYLDYKDNQVVQPLVAQLSWSHNIVLMNKLKDIKIRTLYANFTIKNGWSKRILEYQIKTKFHRRLGNSNNNFSVSLPPLNSDLARNSIKDPYVFDFITLKENYKEKELEQAMINKIKDVLLEMGKGFSFIGNQYKISINNIDYFVDLLFYHLELRCYIVVELKITEFKPEYIGQISFYVKAVDKILKKDYDNQTIGLLLCKEKNKLSVEWALETTNVPIGISSFELHKYIPKELLDKLPTEEDINLHIEI